MIRTLTVATERHTHVLNVTEDLAALVDGVEDGLAFFYVPHTTAALLMCEDDAELRADLEKVAENWLTEVRPFSHVRKNNPNAEAHILSAFGGHGVLLAVEAGRLDLGPYQNLLLLEMDGPKEREIRCKVLAAVP